MPISGFIFSLFNINSLIFSVSVVTYVMYFSIIRGVENGHFFNSSIGDILVKNDDFES